MNQNSIEKRTDFPSKYEPGNLVWIFGNNLPYLVGDVIPTMTGSAIALLTDWEVADGDKIVAWNPFVAELFDKTCEKLFDET